MTHETKLVVIVGTERAHDETPSDADQRCRAWAQDALGKATTIVSPCGLSDIDYMDESEVTHHGCEKDGAGTI